MIIKGFVLKNPLKKRGLIVFSLFVASLFLSFSSIAQTAEAEKNFAQCKACHTIGGGKLVGPDLKGVTEKRDEAWLIKFIQNSQAMVQAGDADAVAVFEENFKIPMPSHNLTDEQVKDILLYIKNGGKVAGAAEEKAETETVQPEQVAQPSLAEQVVEEEARGRKNMYITFVVMIVLLIISLIDIFWTKILKYRWIHIVVILTALWIVSEVLFFEATALGRQQYYQPTQPVWFSHKVHAGQNQIDCMYCHFTADKSMHAGIPSVAVCMNCHSQVKKGKITGEEEIKKVTDAYANGTPIRWIKVHNLPDHVYFNHEQHVKVGKVDCEECHGPVEEMDVVMQVNTLGMGWCIDCHRTKEIDLNNKFYGQYTKLHEKLKNGEIANPTVIDIGGEECAKCHY